MDSATPLAPPAPRRAAIALDPAEFRRLGHALVETLAAFLESVPGRPVAPGESPGAVRAALEADRMLPAAGADPGALLDRAASLLFDHSLFNGHPRFYGYITSSPAPIGMLGELLAAGVNANAGAWRLGPMASEIEAQTVRWIAELVGFPAGGEGLFVSGGNMANFVGFVAARAAAASWDIRAEGVAAAGAPPLRVYASAETHTWIQKAADLFGLGTNAIRWIATDDNLRMDVEALRTAIDEDLTAGARPMLVVGTAGSVSTGAIDPLAAIADLCRERGLWFHVDGAYGAFAAAVDDPPADLRALARADSVALDPHKWLYAPLEAGCLLVRDSDTLRRAFAYHPPYYHFGEAATNFVDLGPQNSRGFRALKVWLALQQVGRDGYARLIADDIRLSERLFAVAAAHPEIEACTQGLSITTFRYVPPDLGATLGVAGTEAYLNAINEALLDRLQCGGEAFVSNAVIRGRYLLRACIVNFHTSMVDVDALPDTVARIGRALDRERRPR